MKDNWKYTEEFLVHTPNKRQQHQTIVEEQRQPLHSPTTPVWGGIADKIITEASVEDKNNDSDISPDHYASNCISLRSKQSSPTTYRSGSSRSDISVDTNGMHCTTYECTSRFVYKDCDSPEELERHNLMDEQQQAAEKPIDGICSNFEDTKEDTAIARDNVQCLFYPFNEPDGSKFREHLISHYTSKCDDLDFPSKSVYPQLPAIGFLDESNPGSPSMQKESVAELELEETDESGLSVPKMNSQGKMKTFRCKQCDVVAFTKLEFWKHSRTHIKLEKLLTCPRCPFVTEYKHHLEYHLRNHFGSKPYKCDKCPYSCVNKSMLNSHLKSHSNIYQYRCSNCNYVTKYCHSLKLHLRKYSHQPAMVLNADGSPNPLPIIDIYGTRRGPKQKLSTKVQDELRVLQHTIASNNLKTNLESSSSLNSQISPASQFTATAAVNGINGVNEPNSINSNQSFSYNHLFSGFSLSSHSLINENAILYGNTTDHVKSKTPIEFTTNNMDSAIPDHIMTEDNTMPNDIMLENTISSDPNYFVVNNVKPDDNSNNVHNIVNKSPAAVVISKSQSDNIKEDELVSGNIPLDLSKPEMSNNNAAQQFLHRSNIKSPKVTGTNRRKGKAVKLERRVIQEDDTDEDKAKNVMEESSIVPSIPNSPGVKQEIKDTKDVKEQSHDLIASAVRSEFTCRYCEIAFGNIIMYTLHMGYHGYENPYTCNMCGYVCTDKVSFFLHIARSKHP